MALGTALVDRARRISNQPSPLKLEGRTQFAKFHEPWFRARLTMPANPETADPAGGRTRVEVLPTLLFGLRDADGNPVGLTTEDEVEVDSKELGRAVYRPDADPQPLRKRRSLIGWEVRLHRIENHPFRPSGVV